MNLKLNDPTLLIDQILINGEWLQTNKTFAVNNPANGELIANVASAGTEETESAITAATVAMLEFSGLKLCLARKPGFHIYHLRPLQILLD